MPRNAANAQLRWYFTNKAEEDVTDIDIFDVIGGDGYWEDGITAKDFIEQLRAVTTSKIHLHINSPGGYVNDGLAMYNAIRQHEADITAFIESQAASAASFVAMAADRVMIAKTAKLFIHDAHGFAWGNASDMRALADILDEESNNIAGIYADRAGGTVEEWREAMQRDGIGTTYRGQAAVDAGLADEVTVEPGRKNLQALRVAAMQARRSGEPTVSEPATVEPEPIDYRALFQGAFAHRL